MARVAHLKIVGKCILDVSFSCFKSLCSRLYLLQLALAQQEWRVPGLLHQLIDYLKSHLSHSFKNVRDSVGA